eukprot:3514912-Pyramimonas_sp.AAC.1
MKEYGGVMHEPFTRIKKELVKETKALAPGERVIIIGNTQQPYLCMKKDEKAFMEFFQKHVYVPLPDYASMRLLWPGLVARHTGRLEYEFDLSTLAHISEGYSVGTLNHVRCYYHTFVFRHKRSTSARSRTLRRDTPSAPSIMCVLV